MQELVTRLFKKHLKETFVTLPDVYQFLINHERLSLVIENLCKEFRMAEIKSGLLSRSTIEATVVSVANMFANAALTHKEQSIMSDNERRRLEAEATSLQDAQENLVELNK